MASNDAFLPQSETMLVNSNAVANTASSQQVNFPGAGGSAMGQAVPPPVALVQNLGSSPVWVSITVVSNRVAAIPAAGNTTFEVPVLPGQSQTFRTPWAQGSSGAEGTAGQPILNATPQTATLYINTISPGVSQPIAVTFGEGV